ncbi:MAG TPA: M56 family metallopeptidase [Thermoanaerobaculia bacterium]|nr:M56 family metallopeptidase [Thermoanaerobaculia bacterium]
MNAFRAFAQASIPPAASHLWTSTLFLLLVLLLVVSLRRRLTAGGRFALVLIGIVKFVIPAALFARPLRALLEGTSPDTLSIRLPLVPPPFPVQMVVVAPRLWPAVALVIWGAVALALVFRLLVANHRVVALSVRTALPAQQREVNALSRALGRVGARTTIDIARSSLPEAPAVLRVFRPLIVLPAGGCDDLSDEELESLLCHECAHVVRHDNLMARIESLICALFWFHPLIWIAQRITVIERERACDEVVAGSADERETYLAALTKFCHAAIVPRLPGVSCMATAKLNERIDHVMNFPNLKALAPSPGRVRLLGTAALAVFTLASGIPGTTLAEGAMKKHDPYAIRLDATRSGELVIVEANVSDNATQQLINSSRLMFHRGEPATGRSGNPSAELVLDVHPDGDEAVIVEARIEHDGQTVQKSSVRIVPTPADAPRKTKYTGQPISLDLKDADLRHLIAKFGEISGMETRVDDGIEGKVTVRWINVPWDQAFATLLDENGLTYRTDNKIVYVSKK